MNQVKLNELIKSEIINIPLYILKMYKEFNLNVDEMILLLFLYNKDDKVFDPSSFAKSLNMDLSKVLESVSKLADKGLISIVTKTNDVGVKEEIIDLSSLYDKVTLKIISELNEKNDVEENIYDIIKKEFNRDLTPMECERIDEWQKNNYSSELIKEAVKEASLNDVHSIRYIDKILYEWNKNGYKSKNDIKKSNKSKEKVEVYKCDWLDSDEEI